MREMNHWFRGAIMMTSAAGLGGCAANAAPPVAAAASAQPSVAMGTTHPAQGAAQVDCTVSDGSGKMLLEGTSFFDEHANDVELDHVDAQAVRSLRIKRLPDAREGGLVLGVWYREKRKNDDTTIELQPMVRVAEKGRSEFAIKLPGGEERRFAISAR